MNTTAVTEQDARRETAEPFARIGTLGGDVLSVTLLLVLIPIQIVASRPGLLFARDAWFDEILSRILVTRPSLGEMFKGLTSGVDNNAPGYFVVTHLVALLLPSPGQSLVMLRVVSLLCAVAALLGVYRCARRFTGPGVSLAAALSLWSVPLFLEHAFEARYYAMFTACVAWTAVLLTGPQTRQSTAALAILATLLSSLHFFAVIPLGLLIGTAFLVRRHNASLPLSRLAVVLAGPLAMTAVNFAMLRLQFHGINTTSWVREPNASFVVKYLLDFLPASAVGLPLVAMAIAAALPARRRALPPPLPATALIPLALLLYPLVLLLISVTYQSVLVPRYFLPALPGLAVATAWATSRASMPRGVIAGLVTALALLSTAQLRIFSNDKAYWQDDRTKHLHMLTVRATRGPMMLTAGRWDAYAIYNANPSLGPSTFIVDPGDLSGLPRAVANDIEFARKASGLFGLPRTIPLRELLGAGEVPGRFDGAALAMLGRFATVTEVREGVFRFSPMEKSN